MLKENMVNQERRIDLRIPVVREVMLSHQEGFRLCRLRDISATGALLDIGWAVLHKGVPVDLMITLHYGDDEKVYHVPSEVVRVTNEGVAIHFKKLIPEAEVALADLILHGVKQHEAVEEELGCDPLNFRL